MFTANNRKYTKHGFSALNISIFIVASAALFAEENLVFDVLKLKVGSRAIAMGGAYSALANTIDASYYNPAGLAQIDSMEISAMHSEWLWDSRYEYAAFTLPLKNSGTLGLNMVWFNSSITTTDALGNETGLIGINDFIFTVAFGLEPVPRLFPNLYFGANFKYAYESLFYLTNTAYMGSFGLLYKFEEIPLSLSFVAENIGVTISNDKLPVNVRAGLTYKLEGLGFKDTGVLKSKRVGGVSSSSVVKQNTSTSKSVVRRGGKQIVSRADNEYDVIICSDFIKTINGSYGIAFGAEFILPVKFSDYVRARIGGNSTGGVFSLTGGFGFFLDEFVLEYALSTSEIGIAHQPQITYRF